MTRTFVFILLITLFNSGVSQDDGKDVPEAPALPRRVDTIEGLTPKDWVVLAQAKGDLNKDKKPDAVVVLTHSDPRPENPQSQRILVVLLAKDKGFEVSAISQTAVRSRFSGGILGDPFQELKIERGTFVISHYGGSRDRWGFKHRYRFQNDEWFLIGRTSLTEDTLSPVSREKDENLVTGRVVEIAIDENGKRTETDTWVKLTSLLPFAKVDAEDS